MQIENRVPIKSSWNEAKLLIQGPLTDKKIEHYWDRGYYSSEFKEARKELMLRKQAKRQAFEFKREGNFLIGPGERFIYSPL